MRRWTRSANVIAKECDPDWPTPETSSLWRSFVSGLAVSTTAKWSIQEGNVGITWDSVPAVDGTPLRLLYDQAQQNFRVFSTDLEPLGSLPYHWKAEPVGIALGEVTRAQQAVAITYVGPADFFSES